MKTRFIVVLLGMLIPMTSFAVVPNGDYMNLATNLVENIQTGYSMIENGLQVTTLQSTMSKMGSAKSSVSGLFNKLKDVATKAKEKFDKYKGAIEKAAAKGEAIISAAKEIQEEGLDGYLKNNAGDLAGKVGLDGNKVQNAVNSVDNAVQGIKEGGLGGYLKNNAGDLAGKVGLDGNKVQNAVNSVDNAVQGIKEGGVGGYLKNNAGDLAGKVGLDGDKVQNAVNSVDNAVQGIKESGLDGYLKENAGDLAGKVGLDGDKVQNAVDGIDKATDVFKGNSTKGELQGSADASDVDAKTNTTTSVKDKLVDTPQTTPMKRSLEGFSGKTVSDDVLKTVEASKEDVKAVSTPSVEASKEVSASVTPIAEIKNVKIQSELKKASSVKAEAPQKAVKSEATIQNVVKPEEVIKDDSVSKKVDINDVKKVKDSEKAVPKRVQFKSSFGYGKVQNKYQLGFANIDSTTKIGETPEGVLVVPESVYLNCNLDYEAATSDKKMDTCLKKINDVVVSEVSEETPKGMIDDYARDIYNGYVEYLTATYFEALETYNDSLTFKNNEIDPIRTSSTSDIDGSWAVVKEMHMVLGSRFNKLRKLWARKLGMKMYSQYVNEKFTNDAK